MVNNSCATAVKFLVFLWVTTLAFAQSDADRERRLADLERKIALLDAAFEQALSAHFDQRLAAAEQKIEQLLAQQRPATSSTETAPLSTAAPTTRACHLSQDHYNRSRSRVTIKPQAQAKLGFLFPDTWMPTSTRLLENPAVPTSTASSFCLGIASQIESSSGASLNWSTRLSRRRRAGRSRP